MSNFTPIFLVRIGEREFGPLSLEQLKEMVARGTLRQQDEVQRAGGTAWRPEESLRGLFSNQSVPSPSPNLVLPPSIPSQQATPDPLKSAGLLQPPAPPPLPSRHVGQDPIGTSLQPIPQPPSPQPPASYHRMSRRLAFIRLRQWTRSACDFTGLGPSPAGRLCCILLLAAVPFAGILMVSFPLGLSTGSAIALALAVFVLVVSCGSLLVLLGSDTDLANSRDQLVWRLPAVKAAWQAEKQTLRDQRRAKRERLRKIKTERAAERESKATREATHRTAWREEDDATGRLEEWKRARRTYLTGNELRGRKERALLHAAQGNQSVSIVYNAGETPGTQRRILPRQFFKVEGFRSVYVQAYDFLEQEDRTFKVRYIEIG